MTTNVGIGGAVPGGGGGLLAGAVYARVGAIFDSAGWDAQQKAVDAARVQAKDAVLANAGVTHDDSGSTQFMQTLESARGAANDPILAQTGLTFDSAGSDQFKTAIDEAHQAAADPVEAKAGLVVDPAGNEELTALLTAAREETATPIEAKAGLVVDPAGVTEYRTLVDRAHQAAATPVEAKAGLVVDPAGATEYQTLLDRAHAEANTPIETEASVVTDPAGAEEFKQQIDTTRAEAAKPIVQRAAIVTDPAGFNSYHSHVGVAQEESKSLEKDFEGLAGKASGLGFGLTKFAGGIGGMLAAFGGFEIIKSGTSRLGEMQQTAAITTARLKSTGDAAGVSAKQMDELSTAEFKKTGVDHEQILAAENLELTFSNITDKLGGQHNLFQQVTRDALDLSVGTGKDLTSAMRMVGIAMQDPETGLTRLSRAGVVFTAEQKAQITALESSGNQYQAQEVILHALETRYSGTADAAGKTMPAAMSRAKTAFSDVSAMVVSKLAPAITSASDWFSGLATDIEQNIGPGRTIRDVITSIGDAISGTVTFIGDLIDKFKGSSSEARDLRGALVAVLALLVGFEAFKTAAGLVGILEGAWGALSAAFAISPFGVVLAGVAALVLALQVAGIHWQSFGQFASAAWKTIKQDVGTAVSAILGWIRPLEPSFMSIGKSVAGLVLGFVGLVAAVAKFAVTSGILSTLGQAVQGVVGFLVGLVAVVLKLVDSKPGLIALGIAATALVAALAPLGVALAVEKVKSFGTTIVGLAGQLKNATLAMKDFFAASVKGDVSGAKSALSRIFGSGSTTTGAAGAIAAIRGDTPADPMYVFVVNQGVGGVPGVGGPGVAGATAAEGEAAAAAASGESAVAGDVALTAAGGSILARANAGALGTAEADAPGLISKLTGALPDILGNAMKGGMIALGGSMVAQLAGSIIGGKAGKDVSSIGGDAAMGAGAGMLLGPEGAVVGGLAGGAYGALKSLGIFGGGPSPDDELKKLDAGIKQAASDGNVTKMRDLRDQADALANSFKRAGDTADAAKFSKLTTGINEVIGAMQGQKVDAFVTSLTKVHDISGTAIFSGWTQAFAKNSTTVKDEGAKAALMYAEGLAEKGAIPQNAVQQLVKRMESQFPPLTQYLRTQGLTTDQELASALRLTKSQSTLQASINAMQTQFGYLPKDAQVVTNNMTQQFDSAMTYLQGVIKTSTGKQRDDALAAYSQLKTQAVAYFTTMTNNVEQKQTALTGAISQGSQTASQDAITNYGNVSTSIQNAMAAGVLAANQGTTLLAKNLNLTLKALGVSPIVIHEGAGYSTTVQTPSGYGLPTTAPSQAAIGKATGGYLGYKGERKPDGQLVVAAPGEAFLTHQDQPHVDQALATAHIVDPDNNPYVSLDHMFGADHRPKHFAQGGTILGYAAGGKTPGALNLGNTHASHLTRLQAAMDKVSSANFPYHWGGGHEQPSHFEPFDCSGAVSYVVQQAGYNVPTSVSGSIGSEWHFPAGQGDATIFYNPTHTFMRLGNRYWGTSGFARPGGGAGWFDQSPGSSYLAGFSTVHLPDLGSSSLTAGGGGSSLAAPTVSGPAGSITNLIKGALGKVTGAANTYLGKVAPAGSGGNGGQGLEQVNSASLRALDHQYPAHHTGTAGTQFSPTLVAQIAQWAGLPGVTFSQIAHGESNYMPGIVEWPPEPHTGAQGFGLWQITSHVGNDAMIASLGGPDAMRNPLTNAKAAKILAGSGNSVSPWHGTKYMTSSNAQYTGKALRFGGRVLDELQRFTTGGKAKTTNKAPGSGTTAHHVKRTIPTNILKVLAGNKGDKKLVADINAYNKDDTDITDLGDQYSNLQRAQTITDKQYGSDIPGYIVQSQADALLKLKRKMNSELNTELKAATRIGKFVGDWLPNRQKVDAAAVKKLTDDEAQLAKLKATLTQFSQRSALAKMKATSSAHLKTLETRLATLRKTQGTVKKHPTPPVQYDPYGNKLPTPPATGTPVDNTTQIAAVQQQIQAEKASASKNIPTTEEKDKLANEIKALETKIATEKFNTSEMAKEIAALTTLQTNLGSALDPQSGLASEIASNTLDMSDLSTSLPAGDTGAGATDDGAGDWTQLDATEQAQLDQINYALSVAEGLPADQQAAAEIPLTQALVGLWGQRIQEAKAGGAPLSALTTLQNTYDAAEQQLTTLTSTPTADQSAILNQQTTEIQNLQALNLSAEASIGALGSSGDIGTGGYGSALGAAASSLAYGRAPAGIAGASAGGGAAGGGGVAGSVVSGPGGMPLSVAPGGTLVLQSFSSLHPADPTVKSQIAAATVDALGGQQYQQQNKQAVL